MLRVGIDRQPERIFLCHIEFNFNGFCIYILLTQRNVHGFGYFIIVDVGCIGVHCFIYPEKVQFVLLR